MKRALSLLLIYLCLTITVGKQVRSLCIRLVADKNVSARTFSLDFAQSEAESEECDSEDSEENEGEDYDDNELAARQVYVTLKEISLSNYPSAHPIKDHLQEIGTPPPRC